MNICFIVTRGDSIGGAQIHVRDMAIALRDDGHLVTVLTGTPGDMTDQLDAADIHWEHIPWLIRPISPWKDLCAIFSISLCLHKLKPDLLSCHTAKSGMVGRVAAFLSGVPGIFTAHGWQFADGIPKGQARAVQVIEKLVAPLCRKVITVSHYDFDLALRKRAVKREKMVTIHNGLPWRDESSVHSSVLIPGTERPCRLIMVARFQEQKDHATLINALAGIDELNWQLELVGDGSGMTVEQTRVHKFGLDSQIEFTGQQLDVPERMEQVDIYLLITNWEGFPRSIIEAMRAGLPVIASDVGGCNESIVEGKTGYLVPKGAVDLLRERITELILNPDLRSRMGQAGRIRYETEFTFQKMYEKSVELYREIVSL